MRHILGVALSALLLLSLLVGCERAQKSYGVENQIFVFADSTEWTEIETPLKRIFEKKILTPQPEYLFTLTYSPVSELTSHTRFKNLLLVGVLDQPGPAADAVKSMLSAEALDRVNRGQAVAFQKKDPWAEGQLLVVLVAKTQMELENWMDENSEFLYSMFHEQLYTQLVKEMYSLKEQKDIERQLMQKYGWMVRVQHDYFIYKEDSEYHFVALRRSYPERWLFVYWVDTDDPSFLTPEWVIDKRDEIGQMFYGGDTVNRDPALVKIDTVDFLGREAIQVRGVWENAQKQAGGPFETYAFYDEPTMRVYVIDLAVFRPGDVKEPLLRQLDVIAHTFRTSADVESNRGSN